MLSILMGSFSWALWCVCFDGFATLSKYFFSFLFKYVAGKGLWGPIYERLLNVSSFGPQMEATLHLSKWAPQYSPCCVSLKYCI